MPLFTGDFHPFLLLSSLGCLGVARVELSLVTLSIFSSFSRCDDRNRHNFVLSVCSEARGFVLRAYRLQPLLATMNGHVNTTESHHGSHTHKRRESLQLNLTADDPEEVYGLKHPVAHPRITVEDETKTDDHGRTNVNANIHAPLDDSADEEDDDHDEISSLLEDAIEELGDEKLLESDNGGILFCLT